MNIQNILIILSKLIRPILLSIMVLLGVWYWLGYTQLGLRTIIATINFYYHKPYSIEQVTGTVFSKIVLKNISAQKNRVTIGCNKITITINSWRLWQQTGKLFEAQALDLLISFSPKTSKHFLQLHNAPILITKLPLHLYYAKNKTTINIPEFTGAWQQLPVTGKLCITTSNNKIDITDFELIHGQNNLKLTTISPILKNWSCNISNLAYLLPTIQRGQLIGSGMLTNADQQNFTGTAIISNLQSNGVVAQQINAKFQIPTLNTAPLKIKLNSNNISFANHDYKIKLKTLGTKQQSITTLTVQHKFGNILAEIAHNFTLLGWNTSVNKFTLQSGETLGTWQLNAPCELAMQQQQLSCKNCKLVNTEFAASLVMHGTLDQNSKKINAEIATDLQNIAWLMRWLPDITRLKGILTGSLHFTGTVAAPIVTTDLHLTKVTMTLPHYGIKIKPLELHATGNTNTKIRLTGQGQMRRGPGIFQINGFWEPKNSKISHAINITGKNVEFIKTDSLHLIADPQLLITFKDLYTMQLSGKLQVLNGKIDLDKKFKNAIYQSKDIKIINQKTTKPQNSNEFKIIPDLFIRLERKVKLIGFGLNAIISGKLKITKPGQNYLGEGRISAKKGSYKITGQKLYIHYGKLYYPPGTLLNNPYLDIKISKNKPDKDEVTGKRIGYDTNKTCLYIQGTWLNPIVQDNGLIKNDQAIAQMVNFGSGSLVTKLQNKFKLSEFSIGSEEIAFDPNAQETKNDGVFDNKSLIVGKKLNKKLYLQYSKGLMSTSHNTIKLKYLLGKNWSVGVEAGTLGNGADLSFSYSKD